MRWCAAWRCPWSAFRSWTHLAPGRLELELRANTQLDKHWRHLMKKEAKAVKAAAKEGQPPPAPDAGSTRGVVALRARG